jgi:hypothetical protein
MAAVMCIVPQVQGHLDKFIASMQHLFERYKGQAGYADKQLVVI